MSKVVNFQPVKQQTELKDKKVKIENCKLYNADIIQKQRSIIQTELNRIQLIIAVQYIT